MKSSNKTSLNKLKKSIEAVIQGDNNPFMHFGFTEDIIHNVLNITNIYSHLGSLIPDIIAYILRSHAPKKGLIRFERFLETSAKQVTVDSYVSEFPFLLAMVFASSGALSNRLNADDVLVRYLSGMEQPVLPRMDNDYYRVCIGKICNDNDSIPERIKAVHRMHTLQLIRICARNADPGTGIAEITGELSALADTVIEYCLQTAILEMSARSEHMIQNRSFFILGLGKLGGRELNVSSDIDLMYLSDEKGGWESYDTLQFYTSLAERLTRLLTEATEYGYLYRVDTRLRADGSSGPLVRTTDDYLRYLEIRGKGWERQMLLKARPVAGNSTGARAFLDSLAHFIYPSSITRSPNREIVELKNQIEAKITTDGSKKTHLKLMPGGIRDIEFITQCLQLLTGGKHPEVRCSGTLPALARLKDINAVNDYEYQILTTAYRLYRRIENALMWRELLPVFNLPVQSEEMQEIIQYLDVPDLPEQIDRLLTEVRAIYDEIFTAGDSDSFDDMALRAARNLSGDEKVKRFLENLGFNDPETAANDLSMLVFGKNTGGAELAVHLSIERFLPKLLKALSELPDPAVTLKHFRLIAESYNARTMLFDIMENNSKLFDMLLTITHGSVFISDILINDPSLLDWLVEAREILRPINKQSLLKELHQVDRTAGDDLSFTRECFRIKNREKLRTGTRDITGLSNPKQTFSDLSIIAECIVQSVFQRAFREFTAVEPQLTGNYSFSIVAAGKLGSGMMNFGSDLDLIFIYDCGSKNSNDMNIPEQSVHLAQKILSLITGGGGAYKIYDVDARLRPEGGNSPLAVSFDEYIKYLEHRASVWERLAMVRARYLTGSRHMKSRISETLRDFVYRRPLSGPEMNKIIALRKKMVEGSSKRYPGRINIKSGDGGITDIDFIAQSYAVHFGSGNPNLRLRDTAHILEALGNENILKAHDVSSLLELHGFLRNVEKSLRIGSGKAVNTLPKSGKKLSKIARLSGYTNIRRFNKRLEDVISLTKEHYHRLMQELLVSSGDEQA